MKHSLRLVRIAAAATLLSSAPALAQEESGGWVVTLGPGAAFRPTFPGSDELELGIWPIIDIRRGGSQQRFEAPDDNIAIGLIDNRSFRAGPSLAIKSGRDEEDAILGIGDVGTTIEGGVFAEAFLTQQFRLRGDVRKGFGGHKGLVADIGADAIAGDPSDRFHISAGPRLRLANKRYVRAFYGINPEQSAQTGLPIYDDIEGGLHSAGALTYASYRFTPSIGMRAYGRYDRLLGDAKDSPLVRSDIGSRNQYEFGLGLTYTFTVR